MATKKRTYNVKFRLDGVLVEVCGVSGIRPGEYGEQIEKGLEGAIANARQLCLMKFVNKSFKGMTIEDLKGQPRVVGVETSDAWPA